MRNKLTGILSVFVATGACVWGVGAVETSFDAVSSSASHVGAAESTGALVPVDDKTIP